MRVNLLVTRGSGFIGSNFVRHVLATRPDDTVVNLDKLTYAGNPANLKDVERDPRYAFVHGDICDGKLVRDRKSTRLNSSHVANSYDVFCLKEKNQFADATVRRDRN